MKLFGIPFASFVSVVILAHSAWGQATSRTWIADATIISPDSLENVTVGSVLVEDGRIVRVERGTHARMPNGATLVSAKGQFLIPGLVDSHVHLAGIPGVDENSDHKPQAEVIRGYFEQLPRSYLYFGYTTLIDLAVVNRSVLEDFRQAPLHPDLYDCGPSLPVANGYPMSFLPAETRFQLFPNWLLDPQHASDLPPGYDPGKHTPAAVVATIKNAGGICVKTYFERGFGRARNLPVITPELIAQVRQAAQQSDLVLIMHANSFEAQRFAVDSGVDVIAHGMWNWADFSGRPELPPEMQSLLDRIVEKKIGVQPTMQVMQGGFRAYFDPAYLQTSAVAKVVSPQLLAWFNSSEGKWFKQEITEGREISDMAARQGLDQGPIRQGSQVVAYLARKNARLLFGTDTPSAPSYGNLPGLNQYLEMQDLYSAGVSLRQILRAATIENAGMFHLDSQVGTIEPGKVANLLLLKKSPLATIDAYDSIVTVFLQGKPISRDSLAVHPNPLKTAGGPL
jgi:imidazolonepropionase-like amidohydrolase